MEIRVILVCASAVPEFITIEIVKMKNSEKNTLLLVAIFSSFNEHRVEEFKRLLPLRSFPTPKKEGHRAKSTG
jgi:hypothetical protein